MDLIGRNPLIGREDELRRIGRLLDDLRPGRPAVLVLEGPRGSGRSRLLDETARLARRRGMRVLAEPDWTGPDGARRFRRSLSDQAGPLLVLADDPRRIDPPTWSLLSRLAATTPVLVTVTSPDDGTVRLPIADVHRVVVLPLAPAAQTEFVARIVGARPDPLLMDLCRVAAGRPAALRDLAAGLQEEGLLRIEAGWATVRATRLPRSIAAALRIEPLRRPVRRLPGPVAEPPVRGPVDWSVLSPREHEVAGLVGLALTNRQIASRTGISVHTVNYHLRQIFRKLGISSRVEVVTLLHQRVPVGGNGSPAEPSSS